MENQDDNHKEDGHKNSQKPNGHCTQEQKCYNKVASYKTADRMLYPILKDNARENRKQMTEGERVLWNELRAKKTGYRFLRQHAIGEYIVDFVCLERKVMVEVDGGYHAAKVGWKVKASSSFVLLTSRWSLIPKRLSKKSLLPSKEISLIL